MPSSSICHCRGSKKSATNWRTCSTRLKHPCSAPPEISPEYEEKLLKAVMGLTAHERKKPCNCLFGGREQLDDEVFKSLMAEKRHLVQGSDLLEFYDLDEGVKDVGGLEVLKDWLAQRANAFTERAKEQGIPMPKGMLLWEFRCRGKSLTACAATSPAVQLFRWCGSTWPTCSRTIAARPKKIFAACCG